VRKVILGELCKIGTGQSAPQEKNVFCSTGTPFVRAGSLDFLLGGGSEFELEKIEPQNAKKYRLKLYPAETIVFAKSGMSAKIGRVYQLKRSCYLVSHLAAVEPCPEIDAGYLQRWFQKNSPSRLIANEAYPSIRTSDIQNIKLTLPSLEEQKRIAAILDKADAVRRKRQQAIELADKFLQSVFLDMFGDPVTNPKGFEVSEIGIECEIKGGKRIPKGDTLVRYDTGFPYIKAGNIKDGEVTGKHLEYVTPEVRDKIKRYTVNKGDICITVVGANIGDVGIVPEELHLASLTENANKILINDKNRLRTDYLAEALTTDFIQKQIKQKTMAVGVPKLALFRIQQLKILVPPIEVQKDFEKRKRLLVGLLKKSNENLSASERIFTSLSQQAFKGELTKDEAA